MNISISHLNESNVTCKRFVPHSCILVMCSNLTTIFHETDKTQTDALDMRLFFLRVNVKVYLQQ